MKSLNKLNVFDEEISNTKQIIPYGIVTYYGLKKIRNGRFRDIASLMAFLQRYRKLQKRP